MISGDLMLFPYRIRESVEVNWTAALSSADKFGAFAQEAERYLRFLRQLERLAQIERQLSQAPKPAPLAS